MVLSHTTPLSSQIKEWVDFQVLLGQQILTGISALQALGISVSVTRDLRRLVELNRLHLSSWGTLFPAMDPEQAKFDHDHGLIIEGRDENGNLIFTDAVRMLEIYGSDLKTEFETFHAYYGEPDRQRRQNEWIEITAPSSRLITGRVGLIGGLWVAPERRGAGLTKLFAPIVRWYAHSLWNLDWVAAFVHEGAVNAGVAKGYGYLSSEPFVHIRTNAVQGTLHLLSQSREQLYGHILAGIDKAVPERVLSPR